MLKCIQLQYWSKGTFHQCKKFWSEVGWAAAWLASSISAEKKRLDKGRSTLSWDAVWTLCEREGWWQNYWISWTTPPESSGQLLQGPDCSMWRSAGAITMTLTKIKNYWTASQPHNSRVNIFCNSVFALRDTYFTHLVYTPIRAINNI